MVEQMANIAVSRGREHGVQRARSPSCELLESPPEEKKQCTLKAEDKAKWMMATPFSNTLNDAIDCDLDETWAVADRDPEHWRPQPIKKLTPSERRYQRRLDRIEKGIMKHNEAVAALQKTLEETMAATTRKIELAVTALLEKHMPFIEQKLRAMILASLSNAPAPGVMTQLAIAPITSTSDPNVEVDIPIGSASASIASTLAASPLGQQGIMPTQESVPVATLEPGTAAPDEHVVHAPPKS